MEYKFGVPVEKVEDKVAVFQRYLKLVVLPDDGRLVKRYVRFSCTPNTPEFSHLKINKKGLIIKNLIEGSLDML